MTRISMRARLAPRQKWGPPAPNAMCGLGLRVMSNGLRIVEDRFVAVGRDVEEHDLGVGLDEPDRRARSPVSSGGGSSSPA